MRFSPLIRFLILLYASVFLAVIPATPKESKKESSEKDKWVSVDASGRLVYKSLPQGDHIVDFSYAGYMGGGVALPRVPQALSLAPSGADDTAAIQHAIDQVSALPLKNGFRGAVVLVPGTFLCQGTLNVNASGVVLRGKIQNRE